MVILARPDPAKILRNPQLPCGYACVYLKHDCRPQFVARPFRKLHLGNYSTEREAARAAAHWWQMAYGPEWESFFRCRSRLAWHALRSHGPVTVLRGDGSVGTAATGFRLVCWELGQRRAVFPPPIKAGQSPSAFATRAFAKSFFRDWREKEYGQLHPLVLRRAMRPAVVPEWALSRGGSGFPD